VGHSSLRERLRVLHGRVGCPARPRARSANAAALAADFAALPLRAAWLLGQLEGVRVTRDRALVLAAAEGWLAARDALVEALHGFVVTLALRVPIWHVPFEDRIQAGVLALTAAIEGFDAARGTRVTTYVGRVIERAMRRLGRATPRSAALPRLGLTTDRLVSPTAYHRVTLVTIDTREDFGVGPLTDRLVDPEAPTPEDLAILAVDSARVQAELAHLDPREQKILGLLFGLHGLEARDLRSTGAAIGASTATVRRIRDRALARLTRAVTGTDAAAPPPSNRFLEVSSCPIRSPLVCCSNSTSPSGPGAPRSARPTSVSIPPASPRTTPSAASASSRSGRSIPSRPSSARRAMRSTV
jgi:RNA polymerase sigma factor (sigma-70 family)